MDLMTAMRVFHAVADSGSFTLASDKLGLSRGMASKYLSWLEAHLGTRLLNRTTRRLALTESGADYLARVASILAQVDEAEAQAAQASREPVGTLRVSAPLAFGVRRLGPILAGFNAHYPCLTVEMLLEDRQRDMLQDGVDLTLRITTDLGQSQLVSRVLAPVRLVVCAAPAYLARHGTPATPAELSRHQCLRYTLSEPTDEWRFGSERVKINGPLAANNGDLLVDAARHGMGIICEPTFLLGDDLKSGRLVPLLEGYPLPEYRLYALYPHRQYLPRKVRALVDFLADHFAGEPDWDAY